MSATTTASSPSRTLLERALLGNIVFSLLSGGILFVGSPWLSDSLGPSGWALAAVGAGVVGFGVFLQMGTAKDPIATGRFALAADIAWVVATFALAPFVAGAFTSLGGWVAIAVAVVVADFAILEWVGLRRDEAWK